MTRWIWFAALVVLLLTPGAASAQPPAARPGGGIAIPPTANTVPVGTGSAWVNKTIPDCDNPTTAKLLFDQATKEFTCGTDQTSSVAGSNTQVIFNDAGVAAGDPGLTYNKTTDVLTVGDVITTCADCNAIPLTTGDLSSNGKAVGGAVLIGGHTGNLFAWRQGTGPVLIGAPIAGHIGGTQASPQINNFLLLVNGSTGSKAITSTVPNAGTTGTTVKHLAKKTGAPVTAVITGTSDTDGILGIVTDAGGGTSGNAEIARVGQTLCTFDAAGVTAGDFVINSTATAGRCRSAGATRPTSGRVVGVAMTTAAANADALVLVEDNVSAGGGAVAGSDTQCIFNDAGAYAGDAGCTYNKTTNTLTVEQVTTNGAGVGLITATAGTAPSTPAGGKGVAYVDSTTKTLSHKDDTGVVTTTVKPDTGAANNFLTAVSAAGVISKAQPAFSNLSGAATTGQITDANVTYAKIQNVTDARLLGRSSGSAGPPMEVTVGAGLSLSGGALTASAPNVNWHQSGFINSAPNPVAFGASGETFATGFALPAPMVATKIRILVAVADAGNNYTFGIYNSAGTLEAKTTAASIAGTGYVDLTITTGGTLTAGRKYFAIAGQNVLTISALTTTACSFRSIVNVSASVMPSTITPPADSLTCAADALPWFILY